MARFLKPVKIGWGSSYWAEDAGLLPSGCLRSWRRASAVLFRAVASDAEAVLLVVLGSGPLASAMRVRTGRARRGG